MSEQRTPKGLLKYIRFTGMGLQMGITIWLGSLLGAWLDQRLHVENQLFYKGVTMFAVFGSIFSFIRQVIKISKDD